MKLFLNRTSPYARMVRIVMLEKGLADQVELCWCDPWRDDPQLLAENPLGRIPTLVCDSGVPLSESLLIASYLDARGQGNSLLPGSRKEAVMHLAGLGQGLMDAAFSSVISRKYLNNDANDSVLSHWRLEAIQRTLAQLEQNIHSFSSPEALSLGDISLAVALDYLRFRLPELASTQTYPTLEAWRTDTAQRASFQDTAFE